MRPLREQAYYQSKEVQLLKRYKNNNHKQISYEKIYNHNYNYNFSWM